MASRIAKINGKYYDKKTNNKSFLKVATDLKKVGIKNYYFMLEIKDVSLVGIDPYAVDEKTGKTKLTKDQIKRIMIECSRNPWYYLREICRIPESGQKNGVPYRANRGNIAQTWCILHGYDSWLCLPRQQGKTISAIAIQAWAYSFGTSNSEFIFINKDGDNAKENLRRLKAQIDLLPEYLRFESYMDEDGKVTRAVKNATRMQHPITNNSIRVKPKATSYSAALNLARGLTAPILHFDEPEFTHEIKTIVENSVSTYRTAADNSKKNHTLYSRIFTCTPGDLDTPEGLDAQLLLEKTRKWTEQMYDWTDEQCIEYIEADESNHILYIEYDYHQLGKTEEWFRSIAAEIGNPLTTRREILLQRLKGSSTSPYPREDIDFIIDVSKKPIKTIMLKEYYQFDIYEELQKNVPYIVGVDCSTGTVGDNNAITVLNPYTCQPVAEFECSYIGETMYENIIKELVRKYIPKAIVCIERNSVGDGIIDHLMYSPIAQNLYFDKARDLQDDKMKEFETTESMLKHNAKKKTFYGVYTSGNSRETMFKILANHVSQYKENFVTQNIVRDLSRLVMKPSGKIEAQTGFHDDSIMSYLIALYVYYHGNNLELFGFVRGDDVKVDPTKGLQRPDDIYSKNLSKDTANMIHATMEREQVKDDYEDLLRSALIESQKETAQLYSKNLVSSDVLENTPDYVIDDYEENTGSLDLGLFDQLNNFSMNGSGNNGGSGLF